MNDFPFTSRSEAMTVACPRCNAEVGEKCVGVRGKPRERIHRERMNIAAAKMGLPAIQGFSLRGDKVLRDDGTVVGRLVSVEIDFQATGAGAEAGEPTEREKLELELNEDALLKRNTEEWGAGENQQTGLLPDPIEETWELYVTLLERPKIQLTPKYRKWIADAHKAAGVELTQQAIRGLAASEYHRENNYIGIEYAIVPKRGQSIEGRIEFMAAKAPANDLTPVGQYPEHVAAIEAALVESAGSNVVDEGRRRVAQLRQLNYEPVIDSGRVIGLRTL